MSRASFPGCAVRCACVQARNVQILFGTELRTREWGVETARFRVSGSDIGEGSRVYGKGQGRTGTRQYRYRAYLCLCGIGIGIGIGRAARTGRVAGWLWEKGTGTWVSAEFDGICGLTRSLVENRGGRSPNVTLTTLYRESLNLLYLLEPIFEN